LLGGKYRVARDERIMVLLQCAHRDPAVWGADADVFRPERWAGAEAAVRPASAFSVFGNGERA